MTQPPDESPPDDGWQPPGPGPQPPVPPPSQPNPYGGPSTSYYQPIDSGRMADGVKIVIGVVIGVFGGFFLWFVAAIAFSAGGTGSGDGFLFFAAVAPLIVPAPLLIWRPTRPWALGLLIGTAISSIGMSGICATLITGL